MYAFTLGEPDTVMLPCALPFRDSELRWTNGGDLSVQLPGQQVLDAKQRKRLNDGFRLNLAIRVYVFDHFAHQPMSLGARTCHLDYDLWNEVYRLVVDVGPKSTKKTTSLTLDRSMRACLGEVLVIDRATLGKTPSILAAIIDVDPPTTLLAEIKQVIAAGYGPVPSGGGLDGTFQSLFCTASNALRFRTQVVTP